MRSRLNRNLLKQCEENCSIELIAEYTDRLEILESELSLICANIELGCMKKGLKKLVNSSV